MAAGFLFLFFNYQLALNVAYKAQAREMKTATEVNR